MAEPFPLCYLNGEYLPIDEARISPLDRGFLYSDGVYEVMPVYGGRPFRFGAHAQRMTRSLAEIRMDDPHTREEWHEIIAKLDRAATAAADQYVYWQVTRGAERGRNHAPLPDIPRTVFAFCAPFPVASAALVENGVACVTAQDTRWARCDIKSVSLLANVLLRQLAVDANASETILLRDGELMEASSSAVHVVIDGEVRSPPNSQQHSAEHHARRHRGAGGPRERSASRRRASPRRELRNADEIWLTAAVREMSAVTRARRQAGRHAARPGRSSAACATRSSATSASWRGNAVVSGERGDPERAEAAEVSRPTTPSRCWAGRPPEFRARIHAIVLKHVPERGADRISERLSENGNFLSISYMIAPRAASRSWRWPTT